MAGILVKLVTTTAIKRVQSIAHLNILREFTSGSDSLISIFHCVILAFLVVDSHEFLLANHSLLDVLSRVEPLAVL